MSVRNIVKVMNFHALLRVNHARSKVSQAKKYEEELKHIINHIVNNRIFKQEKISMELPEGKKELNIYIGSDLGFCASYNADVLEYLKKDDPINDKVIIGKKINYNAENIVLKITKEEFYRNYDILHELMISGLLNKEYSKINIIYIHYYNLGEQKIIKRMILPFDYSDNESEEDKAIDDFVVEGDLEYIIWDLIVSYLSLEINISEAWSWASENVQRQIFTSSSLDKIEKKEEEQKIIDRKIIRNREFKSIIERNNKRAKNNIGDD